ncbi:MAG: hypothetical protein ACEY3I_02850 [Arsenophonus sp.]
MDFDRTIRYKYLWFIIIITRDEELANCLIPSFYEIKREYVVRGFGEINDAKIHQLIKGIQLEDGEANFKFLKFCSGKGRNQWFNITLIENT